jgi:hypothetical protein
MIRLKFKCDSITQYESCSEYSLHPVWGGDENRVFWEATPSGSLKVTTLNTKGQRFQVGKHYYVDIMEVI